MRISDWSSDGCSSDLFEKAIRNPGCCAIDVRSPAPRLHIADRDGAHVDAEPGEIASVDHARMCVLTREGANLSRCNQHREARSGVNLGCCVDRKSTRLNSSH